jgi:hypothetical protein
VFRAKRKQIVRALEFDQLRGAGFDGKAVEGFE